MDSPLRVQSYLTAARTVQGSLKSIALGGDASLVKLRRVDEPSVDMKRVRATHIESVSAYVQRGFECVAGAA